MAYISSIVVDFGSSNSGCARVELSQGNGFYRRPVFLHGNQVYAKDDTWFFVRPDFWERSLCDYEGLADSDFRILSRVLPYTDQPNVIWGRQHIAEMSNLIEAEKWVSFKHFKMHLYKQEDYLLNGTVVPIAAVVRFFLRLLKIECLAFEEGRRHRPVATDEIQWGVTIPSIWADAQRLLMTFVSESVFGSHVRILSEPEGPLLSLLFHSLGDGREPLKVGRVSLVVDMGGGTTDITLLKEVSTDPASEYPLQVLATADGVGVGGNNIDEAFWTYMLRFISRGKSDGEVVYDSLSNTELRSLLLDGYVTDLRSYIELEDTWLKYKTGESLTVQLTSGYRKWLCNNGFNSVAETVGGVLVGTESIDKRELDAAVFMPTQDLICDKVSSFVIANKSMIPKNKEMFSLVLTGGLSLNRELRSRVEKVLRDLDIEFNIANMAADPVSVSGSIMDGACIVLLNRQIINRKAPLNIFYDIVCSNEILLKYYGALGAELCMDDLDRMESEDESIGAVCEGEKALPVAVKDRYFKEHTSPFRPHNANQEKVRFTFYGADEDLIIWPLNNPKCFVLGTTLISTGGHQQFEIKLDFNESPINNNFHYYITGDGGRLFDEGNIPIRKPTETAQ